MLGFPTIAPSFRPRRHSERSIAPSSHPSRHSDRSVRGTSVRSGGTSHHCYPRVLRRQPAICGRPHPRHSAPKTSVVWREIGYAELRFTPFPRSARNDGTRGNDGAGREGTTA
ncbi:MAG: hypothetical protein LBB79_05680 [Prevotellaceae bacterium]|nr:hypothetical protein [Prevotellaceae bacterium]